MPTNSPLATVVLPIFNAELYLTESIESVLNQSFLDFILLIIDDGSTDDSGEVVKKYQDDRIQFIQHKDNLGLIATLNEAIEMTDTKYLIRMDADDISLPSRFEKQVSLMEQSPEIIVCGTWAEYFDDDKIISLHKTSQTHDLIHADLLFRVGLIHATAIFRIDYLKTKRIQYLPEFIHAEDYELWARLAESCKFANIPEILYKIRQHSDKVSQKFSKIQLQNTRKIQSQLLQKLNITPTEQEWQLHHEVVNTINREITIRDLQRIDNWLSKIFKANELCQVYKARALYEALSELWLKNMAGYSKLGWRFGRLFCKSIFSPYPKYSVFRKIKFWFKCFLRID
jgi:glycosyltransferase involved in cell wall biosynthesis